MSFDGEPEVGETSVLREKGDEVGVEGEGLLSVERTRGDERRGQIRLF